MLPSLFISHGSPMLALTPTPAHHFLRELGQTLRPKAVVVVSAHWETPHLQVSSSVKPITIHDFGGFPGAWVPLSLMYPDADVPVVSLSLPSRWSNTELIALGEQLAMLRQEDILVVGSGSLTHNLYELQPQGSQIPAWVGSFAEWVNARLHEGDRDALANWQTAPDAKRNHPTPEHFQPLLVAMGAGGSAATQLHHSVEHGVLAMDVYQFA